MKLPKKSKNAYIRPSEKKRLESIVLEDLSILNQIKQEDENWKSKVQKVFKLAVRNNAKKTNKP